MTTAQIGSLINNNFKQWLSLDDFWTILLSNDGHVYPAKNESQFYFDDTTEIMFVRHTFPYIADRKVDNDFVQCENGWLRLLPGGAVDIDTNISRYHEAFAFEAITSIS